MIAHILQSTLFAAGAFLLNRLLRKNSASVRHRVWFIASIKFLIPFSLLVGLGKLAPAPAPIKSIQQGWIAAAQEIVQPETTLYAPPAASERSSIAVIAKILWAAGFLTIAIWWLIRWKRIHALRKSATAIDLTRARPFSTPIVFAHGVVEPGIVGILRPVLMLPQGIENRLEPEQLDAILAHESAHVHRRDNLTAAIHMAVQAIFWFHPLVWWLGMRLLEERERACDEEVLRLGIRPNIYAEGILNVCRFYVESPLDCVAGVTGSDLKKRIEGIMKNSAALRLSLSARIGLAAAAITVIALPVTFGTLIHAQPPALAFDAASVKPQDPSVRFVDFRITGGRLVAANWTLDLLMRQAYGVQYYYQILGGPDWLRNDYFNVEATAGREASHDEMLAMLRTLLEDRFKLKVHREMRPGKVYTLMQGTDGHKLKPPAKETDRPMIIMYRNTPPELPGVSYTGAGQNATLLQLVEYLSNIVRAPVTDKTGLTGHYDFRFDYRPLNLPPDAAMDIGPSVFDTVRSQLGLKLEVQEGQSEVLVVDHAEKPSPN